MSAAPRQQECEEAIQHALTSVEQVLAHENDDKYQGQVSALLSVAMRSLVQLRNNLTVAQRACASVPGMPTLDQANALISLMAGIEYPLAGIHWPRIRRVSNELTQMLGAQQAG